MNYTKVKANLEKLRAKFEEFQEQFNADGFVDAKEQKVLNELLAEIKELEGQVEARVAQGSEANLQSKSNKNSKEKPVMFETDSAPERTVGAGSRFSKSNKGSKKDFAQAGNKNGKSAQDAFKSADQLRRDTSPNEVDSLFVEAQRMLYNINQKPIKIIKPTGRKLTANGVKYIEIEGGMYVTAEFPYTPFYAAHKGGAPQRSTR